LPFIGIIFSGLLVAQIVATLHVWLSNQSLASNLAALKSAGYFIIPNLLVAPPLTSLKAALSGAIFFTLTIGAGITLIAIGLTYYWTLSLKKIDDTSAVQSNATGIPYKIRFKKIRRSPYIPSMGAFMVLYFLIYLNMGGICVIESLYLIIIPLVVVPLTYRWAAKSCSKTHLRQILISLTPIVMLTLIWSSQWDQDLFIRIRDHLLLESRVGRTINDFYYRFTLYPAEAFKPLSQKMLRTCRFINSKDTHQILEIEALLRNQDYLVVPNTHAADLSIRPKGLKLVLAAKGASPTTIDTKKFITDSNHILADLSQKADTKAFFRVLVFYALIFGFPIMLYAIFYGLSYGFIAFLIRPRNASIITALLCLLIGLTLFVPLWNSKIKPEQLNDLNAALISNRFQVRLAALRKIYNQKLEIADLDNFIESMKSRHISERYWLARALSVSKDSSTYKDLFILLNDSQPIVQCQAQYALGNRNRSSAITPIYHLLKTSDHWYIQWYGYKALRRLGWVQSKPKFF
jgi:hypothetical protein